MPPRPAGSRPQPHTPHKGSIADQLDRVIPAFDALVADTRLGHPLSPAQLHDLEERAQAIAAAVVGAFRRPTAACAPTPRSGHLVR